MHASKAVAKGARPLASPNLPFDPLILAPFLGASKVRTWPAGRQDVAGARGEKDAFSVQSGLEERAGEALKSRNLSASASEPDDTRFFLWECNMLVPTEPLSGEKT